MTQPPSDIRNGTDFKIWLARQPVSLTRLLAIRAALRVFPLLTNGTPKNDEIMVGVSVFRASGITLLSLRILLTSVVASAFPEQLFVSAAAAAKSKAFSNDAVANGNVNILTFASGTLSETDIQARYSFTTIISINGNDSDTSSKSVILDTAFNNPNIYHHELWHGLEKPEETSKLWDNFEAHADSNSEWSFWREWYQGFLDGKPLDWELQKEIALIPDADWEKGPEWIAGKIEEIKARFELGLKILELENESVTSMTSRLGIGGNNPPETLKELSETTKELIVVWEPLLSLKAEASSETPDKSKTRDVIVALIKALKAGFAWCASKADLAVDTTIKWGIPAAGGGFLAMNPDKLAAVIEAAKTWASLLP